MKTQYQFTITSGCSCTVYNEDADDYTPSSECWGDCWDDSIQDFTNITEHLFDANETYLWRVRGIRLWDGDASGFVKARDAEDLLRGMTVQGDWTICGTVLEDRIEYSLSHHDAPMGSSSVVEIVTEEQREEWGLY
jgi:hypothetical protein